MRTEKEAVTEAGKLAVDSLFLLVCGFTESEENFHGLIESFRTFQLRKVSCFFYKGTFNGWIQGFITLNDTVNIWRRISTDDVNAVVQVPKCMRNINIYKVAFDAGQQVFSAVSFSVGTFMINIYGPSGKMERIMKIIFCEEIFYICMVAQNVIKRSSQYGAVEYMFRDP